MSRKNPSNENLCVSMNSIYNTRYIKALDKFGWRTLLVHLSLPQYNASLLLKSGD
jgi:hypothetical protein